MSAWWKPVPITLAALVAALGSLAIAPPVANAEALLGPRTIYASLTDNNIGGTGWPDSAVSVDVTIDDVDGLGPLGPFSIELLGLEGGEFNAEPADIGNADLTPGDIITVKESNSTESKTLTLAGPLTARLSRDGTTVWGTRPSDDPVDVLFFSETCPEKSLTADLVGDDEWTLDVSPFCPDGLRQGPFVSVRHFDSDGDATHAKAPPGLVTMEPGRFLDTRASGSTVDGTFLGAGKLEGGEFTRVQIAGRGDVPADAEGIEVNITAIQNEGRGFATLYPCTPEVPTASSLNYTPGVNIANATTVALNSAGEVCVFSNVTAHYALDVLAWIPPGSDVVTVEPGRFLDTRANGSTVDGTFLGAGKLEGGEFTKVKVAGRGDVPANALGIEVNITAIQNEGRGFATLYPCTPTVPQASSLNYTPGVNIANATTVALNSAGEVCVFSNVTAHYALDVVAYTAPASVLVTVDPFRFLDTRPTGVTVDGEFLGAGKLQGGEFTNVQIAGRGDVAPNAVGVEVNITAIQNEGRGFATLYPCTADVPTASSLNYTPGINIANATTVALNPAGEVCVFSNVTAHYALDVLAFVAAAP